jgi:hypothetical protein
MQAKANLTGEKSAVKSSALRLILAIKVFKYLQFASILTD